MKRRRPEDRLEYELARSRAETVKKKENNRVWEKIGDVNADHSETRKLLYSIAKNYRSGAKEQTHAIKDESGQLLVQPYDIAKRCKEYFDELLNVQGSEDTGVDVDLEVDLEEVIEDITGSEIFGAIARMKRGKATRDEDLPVEIVKKAQKSIPSALGWGDIDRTFTDRKWYQQSGKGESLAQYLKREIKLSVKI